MSHVHRQADRACDELRCAGGNWNSSASDVEERKFWNDYMSAFEEAIRATASKQAPWFVVPADNKWFTRLLVAAAIVDAVENTWTYARGLLDVCGGCEKIRNTPLSPSYKDLLRTGLVLDVLISPWLLVPESGFWSLPVVLLACFFLFGVQLIDAIVEEPFGHERDDSTWIATAGRSAKAWRKSCHPPET